MRTTLTRLTEGDVITMAGSGNIEYLVWYVNDCRAAVVPLERSSVKVVTRTGREITFQGGSDSFNISPDSLCPIVRRMGREGMEAWLRGNKKFRQGGTILEKHSLRDVALAMGHHNWTQEEAARALKAAGYELAERTLKRRLSKGKKKPTKIRKEELETLRVAAPTKQRKIRIYN